MALKNIKIFREIIQNCNKLFGIPEKNALSTNAPALSLRKGDLKEPVLPFQDNETNTTLEVVPPCSLLNLMGQQNLSLGNAFQPQPTQKLASSSFVRHHHYSQKEMEEKALKYGKECVPKKRRRCTIQKEKRKCKPEQDCPSFVLKDCPPGREPPDCTPLYKGKDCYKVMAPYPAYSETCVEYRPENPSECHQCPWRRCRNADSIKVQKIRRKYHTLRRTSRTRCAVQFTPPPAPLGLIPESETLCDPDMICDAKKEPCKPPPGKCEKRKKLEEELKKKQRAEREKGKKAMHVGEWTKTWGILMRKPVQIQNLNPYTLQPIDNVYAFPKTTDTMLLAEKKILKSEKKPPNCQKKINQVPEDRSQNVLAKSNKKDKRPRGDEGKPPPCPLDSGESVECPDKPMKKPKYKRRPVKDAYYRRNEDPYNDDEALSKK